ncbi:MULTISPECIES: hypothetical protein [Thermomonosporaceae]|uniref:hypothetical protein n=1 Tax=Thermomonosporaceae TaxID=2012 RepID=UPI00255AFD2E|nr:MULTISPECIES: hypothetical protein [Thermomonosporaceae]MDL4772962.1 hypothetical protein [Actinomadura xylanilytica]
MTAPNSRQEPRSVSPRPEGAGDAAGEAFGFAPASAPTPERPRRIGLWGAPTCGKTTFLAALRIAAEEGEYDVRLIGCNRASTEFLAENTHKLKIERRFVSATKKLPPNLAWQPHGTHIQKVPGKRLCWKRRRPVSYSVMLDMMDAPGGMFSSDPADRAAAPESSASPSPGSVGAGGPDGLARPGPHGPPGHPDFSGPFSTFQPDTPPYSGRTPHACSAAGAARSGALRAPRGASSA